MLLIQINFMSQLLDRFKSIFYVNENQNNMNTLRSVIKPTCINILNIHEYQLSHFLNYSNRIIMKN